MTDEEKSHLRIEKLRLQLFEAQLVTVGWSRFEEPHNGTCPGCERENVEVAKRRLNTAYADDDQNWIVSCVECFEDAREHYAELWSNINR